MSTGELSATQARTRAAIIEAAAAVLADDRTATLPEIAKAAGVGRTTVHRYFPDRESLINATIVDSVQVVTAAVAAAAPEDGCPVDAMRRVINAMISVGNRLLFLFDDPNLLRDLPPEAMPDNSYLTNLIARGQAEGVFDSESSTQWLEHALYGLVMWACQDSKDGLMPQHAAAPAVIRTFERGMRCRD
ncbi:MULTISPECIES: TetR/AcrR family transcriptional regulator [Mycolicibacterium]|uniref:TetR family transcriptional regulator n=1 Tax=Mycolicibacterium senegalense TaxID=1796 RepID=A0A378SYT3_9MYCO|nr:MULTISPECIES: TetR/AcrR family transcriptional regulator [Mycolicibacterium]MCV7338559.1 helix-turn-helix transcriptional regulator [Mycolicibacterium senegalense]MDR7289506.1 AcrR family transcriptional regulator [Mycolicibacterium senegalense]QZA26339.1 TetR/AcrR family transcriptional regulator; helix-turn-helix transcriptional regulator [Mycolicibacterium senegalense]CDP88956.1 TetR family transcriptional regulator [Mycolicibacterium farcinogenes]STZ53679.1 TetR family transcriptional r